MEQHYITIENISSQNLEICLMDLANLYARQACVTGLQLYKRKGFKDTFLILFENQPSFECFNFFINYLHYPEHLQTANHCVRGFFRTSQLPEKCKFNIGDWIKVYVSKNDKNFDNVNLLNSQNDSYLFDFGGRIKKMKSAELEFKTPEIIMSQYEQLISINPSQILDPVLVNPWWKFW